MAVNTRGRPAVTHTRVVERIAGYTLLAVKLETGRTHQIRVHLAHIGYPVVGDPVYGGRPRLPAGGGPKLNEALRGLKRQALHAARLALAHPRTGRVLAWEAPLPADLAALVALLEEDAHDGRT